MSGSSCLVMPSSMPSARPTSSKSVGMEPMLFPICIFPFSLLTQFTLQDFPRRIHGQHFTEFDKAWIFVIRHVLFRPGHQFDLRDRRSLLQDHKRFDLLAVAIMWHPNNRGQAHHRVGHQHLFNFTWIDVKATTNNHVLDAVDNRDVAILVTPSEVAGMKPAI